MICLPYKNERIIIIRDTIFKEGGMNLLKARSGVILGLFALILLGVNISAKNERSNQADTLGVKFTTAVATTTDQSSNHEFYKNNLTNWDFEVINI